MLMSGNIRDTVVPADCPGTDGLLHTTPNHRGRITESTDYRSQSVDERLIEDPCAALADKFVNELPYGVETVLEEMGSGLSEGRMQRLAVIFKVFPQCSKKHAIELLVIKSLGASQQFIRDGIDYFVHSRPANAISSMP